MIRFSLRTRISGRRLVSRPHGELDGSTACRILDAVAQAPAHIQEIVVDLGGVTTMERFGLDVLARGIAASARGRRVQILGARVGGERTPGAVETRGSVQAP